MNIILEGVVGSTAYGLNRPGSDIDKLGVFVKPLEQVLGFAPGDDTVQEHDPDRALHEVKKFMSLCAKVNPTVTELLWLEDDGYTVRDWKGSLLVESRKDFLSEPLVRSAYGGYAYSQIQRLRGRVDAGRAAADDPGRRAKHARHCMRLMNQGIQLLAEGELTVRVSDPEWYFWVGEQDLDALEHLFSVRQQMMDEIESVLPEKPDMDALTETLLRIREIDY